MAMSTRTITTVVLMVLVTGCYRYRDVSTDALRPGIRVRARVSPAEAEQISRQLGGVRRMLEGEIVAADASAVMMEVQSDIAPSSTASALRQRVSFPPGAIVELQARQFDRTRTIAAVAAGAVVAAAAALAIDGGLLGGDDDKGPPDQQQLLIPLGRLPLPR